MFKLVPNFSLRHNNSFGIDVSANYWLTISEVKDLGEAMTKYPHLSEEKKMIIGGGSNLLFLSDFDGVIISPDFNGYEICYQDDLIVELEVELELSGIVLLNIVWGTDGTVWRICH